jgi:hypothetical protein
LYIAFDEYTAGHLRTCASLEPNKPLQTHLYMKDAQWAPLHRSQTRADWISTFITLVKVTEVYVLYHFGSHRIYWITGICWVYFFLATIIIKYLGLGRAYDERNNNKCLDILAGKLPTLRCGAAGYHVTPSAKNGFYKLKYRSGP